MPLLCSLNDTGNLHPAKRTTGLFLVHMDGDAGLKIGSSCAGNVTFQRNSYHFTQQRVSFAYCPPQCCLLALGCCQSSLDEEFSLTTCTGIGIVYLELCTTFATTPADCT